MGTGTGRWAIEMAQTFPQAQVHGVDLEESRTISGKTPSTPLNYVFLKGNVLQRLPFNDETFDFVHQRLLVAGIPFARWPDVIRELLRVTKRGGWIELVEGGTSSSKEGPAIARLTSWNKALMSPAGIDIYNIHKLAPVAQQNGLNCEQRIYNVPIGTWSGRIGILAQQDLLAVFDSLTPRYQQLLGISANEVNTLRQQVIQEWDDLHYQLSVFVFCGQK